MALLLIRVGEAPLSWTLVVSGVVLTVAGESLRLWAVQHIGVISRTRSERLGPLIVSGPFALVRNPLYIGNILIWVGFALTARLLWMAPVVLVLLALEYHAIVEWEEKHLQAKYGGAYRKYCARVGRWLPFGPRTAVGQPAPDGRWRETLFSERGTLIAIAAGYVLLWTKARF